MLTLNRLLLTASMCCLVATANAAPMDDADAAYRRGDYAQALKILRPLAGQGDAAAQYGIGNMYFQGQGVKQNYQEALKWYRPAAKNGNVNAQLSIALMYSSGEWGVTKNYQEALKWWKLAADRGNADAQNLLGLSYAEGRGVIQNHQEGAVSPKTTRRR